MRTELVTGSAQTVVRLEGRFDFQSHRDFRAVLDKALAEAAQAIQVDLGAIEYLDSSALGMLLMAQDKAKSVGKVVSLANGRGSVKQILEIANFNKLFPMS